MKIYYSNKSTPDLNDLETLDDIYFLYNGKKIYSYIIEDTDEGEGIYALVCEGNEEQGINNTFELLRELSLNNPLSTNLLDYIHSEEIEISDHDKSLYGDLEDMKDLINDMFIICNMIGSDKVDTDEWIEI